MDSQCNSTDARTAPTAVPKRKGIYIGAPACFALEEAIRPVCEAFGAYRGAGGCYLVGSSLERADWRDVDVRLILEDAAFAVLFPCGCEHYEHDARWLVMTVAISERLSRLTGLPIDFQFQPQTHANARHSGRRNAIGLRFAAIDSPAEDAVGKPADPTSGSAFAHESSVSASRTLTLGEAGAPREDKEKNHAPGRLRFPT